MDDLIKRARELDALATPGPWPARFIFRVVHAVRQHARRFGLNFGTGGDADWADSQFCAETRTLLPALADALEAERAKVARLEAGRTWQPIDTVPRVGEIIGLLGYSYTEAAKLDAITDRAALLAIVRWKEAEIAELRAHPAQSMDAQLSSELSVARAEVERLKDELQRTRDELVAAAHSARSYAEYMDEAVTERDALKAEVEKLRADLAAHGETIVRVRNEANEQRARAEAAELTLAAEIRRADALADYKARMEGREVSK